MKRIQSRYTHGVLLLAQRGERFLKQASEKLKQSLIFWMPCGVKPCEVDVRCIVGRCGLVCVKRLAYLY